MARLDADAATNTYANNDLCLHRIENRSDKLACTLHVYAPPLRKMRIYAEDLAHLCEFTHEDPELLILVSIWTIGLPPPMRNKDHEIFAR